MFVNPTTFDYHRNLAINHCNGCFPFYEDDVITDKERSKFIKGVERCIRSSVEYKRWIECIHTILGTGFVCYLDGLNALECKIEIHHYPLGLYELVDIAFNHLGSTNSFQLAEYVMAWHYYNYVGFVPLSSTNHERFHNFTLNIPIDIVEGNWRYIKDNLSTEDPNFAKIKMLEDINHSNVPEKWHIQEKQFLL